MIIWLNGTFGAGKATTATELTALIPGSRIFDTEEVGVMLRHVLTSETVRDFQDWRPWRGLVVATATQVLDYVGGLLVIPQTVLVQQYWREIRSGFEAADIPVLHIALHADRSELTRRIERDIAETGARQWRLKHLDTYETARSWQSQEAHVIDTTDLDPAGVAKLIATQAERTRTATTDQQQEN
ncbi:ATP-binding protein [Nocardia sp. NPDC056100]|uniref:ATP-binding protein n=1 Tax=Nocardia sp. NPDC056100 TaxID=3345712 RepID=UPI0035D66657